MLLFLRLLQGETMGDGRVQLCPFTPCFKSPPSSPSPSAFVGIWHDWGWACCHHIYFDLGNCRIGACSGVTLSTCAHPPTAEHPPGISVEISPALDISHFCLVYSVSRKTESLHSRRLSIFGSQRLWSQTLSSRFGKQIGAEMHEPNDSFSLSV